MLTRIFLGKPAKTLPPLRAPPQAHRPQEKTLQYRRPCMSYDVYM